MYKNIDEFLASFSGVHSRGSDRWTACCPAHDDKKASLSIKLCDNGRILLYCFAGCKYNEILEEINKASSDMFIVKTGEIEW